jgi:hypothetical protein
LGSCNVNQILEVPGLSVLPLNLDRTGPCLGSSGGHRDVLMAGKSPSQHGHCLHSQDHRPTDGSCWVLCRDRQSPGCEVGGHTRQQGRGGTRQPCTCLHKPGNSARHSPDKWSGLPHPSEVVTVTVKDGTYFLSHFVYLIYNLQCRRVGWGTSPVPLPVPAACWERASRQHIEVFSW